MGIVSREVFLRSAASRGHGSRAGYLSNALFYVLSQELRHNAFSGPVNEEAALAAYDQIKDHLLRNGQLPEKSLRPWDIDDQLTTQMDRTQPWLGWEFEVGLVSQEARRDFVGEIWDRWDNVCFDGEGDGDVRSEITFAPQEMEHYVNGTSNAQQFVQMLADKPERMYMSDIAAVGTHVNFSFPVGNVNNIVIKLNSAIALLPRVYKGKDTRKEMFGRSELYGGTFARGDYMEGKYFRTTYDPARFRDYLRTAEQLVNVAHTADDAVVVNLAQMYFEGHEPRLEKKAATPLKGVYTSSYGVLDGTRYGGGINGRYALPDVA